MTDSEKTLAVQVWTKVILTQEHFNQMILQARNHLLTIIAAILAAAVLIYQKEIVINFCNYDINVAAFLFISGIFIVAAFYITEKGYHHLLVGAVKRGLSLEDELKASIPGITLTNSIKAESERAIFFFKMRSATRIRVFYVCTVLLLLFGIYLTVNKTKTLPVPNDAQAGTKALKKFYLNGSYFFLVDEIIASAERYVDDESKNIDKTKVVAVFDIDDTALSTWEILESGEFTWDVNRFNNFVLGARGKRIDGTHRLFTKLKAKGIPVIFLTNRTEKFRAATIDNLRREGFGDFNQLLMRPESGPPESKSFKQLSRQEITASGRTIFLSLGDQFDDMELKNSSGNFLLPNPFY